jgi:hypothetical protein
VLEVARSAMLTAVEALFGERVVHIGMVSQSAVRDTKGKGGGEHIRLEGPVRQQVQPIHALGALIKGSKC